MSAILEAAQEEETRLTTEFEDAKNHFEVRIAAVRNLINSYSEEPEPEPEPLPPRLTKPAGLPPRKAKKKPKPKKTKTSSLTPAQAGKREAALDLLRSKHPAKARSAELLAATGIKDKLALRNLMAVLVESGEVIKTGERAGTRYPLAEPLTSIPASRNEPREITESFDPPPERPRVSMPNGTMESKVVDYLSSQSHAQSPSMIGLKTGLGVQDVVGALNRLADQGRVHKRRIGSGDAYEAVVKGERL